MERLSQATHAGSESGQTGPALTLSSWFPATPITFLLSHCVFAGICSLRSLQSSKNPPCLGLPLQRHQDTLHVFFFFFTYMISFFFIKTKVPPPDFPTGRNSCSLPLVLKLSTLHRFHLIISTEHLAGCVSTALDMSNSGFCLRRADT